jgi:hypothetical protein
LGLDVKPLELAWVEHSGQRKDLQGDPAVKRELLGLINDPHPTSSDFAEDAEIPQYAQLGGRDGFWQWQAGSVPDWRAAQLGHHLQGRE